MTYIFRFDSSPSDAEPLSRGSAGNIERHLLALDKNLFVKTRDLSTADLSHISNHTITGFYASPDEMNPQL